jgi:hypothetical protein
VNDGRYRSVFHTPMGPVDCYQAARDEMRAWLRSKDYDVAKFDEGDPHVGAAALLLHSAANSAEGSQTWRWQLRETKDNGAWVSSLVVHAPARAADNARGWFWIEVEFKPGDPEREAEATRASVPRLVRELLGRVPAYDSLAELTNLPTVTGRNGVDDLIDVLCDPDRRLPAVVASAHPELEFEEWKRTVDRATRFLPGLASIYLLDPLATDEFISGIGRSHAVWGGAIRTYLPDVDPAVAEESLRHRMLTGARVLADPGRAAGILSVLPRRFAAEVPLPGPLTGVNRALLTRTPRSVVSTAVAAIQSQVDELIEERELALKLAEEQEARANTFFEQRESVLAELAERDQRVLELENQVRSLRQRMVATGKAAEAFLPAEEPVAPPATFADLGDWMKSELASIEFTGDHDVLLALDNNREAPTWVRSSWETLRAMQSYADARKAGSFVGDFKMWCKNPPPGSYAISWGRVVPDESDTVKNNPKWRRQREFPVPAAIDPSGRVFMGAHVRIGASGQVSPRLYYHDAVAATGRIYIGYLGRHLTNTRT